MYLRVNFEVRSGYGSPFLPIPVRSEAFRSIPVGKRTHLYEHVEFRMPRLLRFLVDFLTHFNLSTRLKSVEASFKNGSGIKCN